MLAYEITLCKLFGVIAPFLAFALAGAGPSALAGPGLRDGPGVAVGIPRHICAVSVLVYPLDDDRAPRERVREVRVEIVNEQPRNVGSAAVAAAAVRRRVARLRPENHQRAVPDMELDPAAGIIAVGDRARRHEAERVGEPPRRGGRFRVVHR